jgi:hypothetical protein
MYRITQQVKIFFNMHILVFNKKLIIGKNIHLHRFFIYLLHPQISSSDIGSLKFSYDPNSVFY